MNSTWITTGTAATARFSSSRRAFFCRAAAAVAGLATSASLATKGGLAEASNPAVPNGPASGQIRQTLAMQIRMEAARLEHNRPLADHSNNGDEDRYPNKI